MRINNEMRRHRDTVVRRTLNGETYQRGAGTFIMDGVPLSRCNVQQSKAADTDKYLLCGTCGVLLSLYAEDVRTCAKCKQECIRRPDPSASAAQENLYMQTVVHDWMKNRVGIQQQESPSRRVRRRDLTDDTSTVTSAAETYMAAEEAFEQQVRLSVSSRMHPSEHKLTAPVEPGQPYRKFLSGFGMQEPWEKVYSQGERRWLPSRASLSRQQNISNGTVAVAVGAALGCSSRAGSSNGTGTTGGNGSSSRAGSGKLRQYGETDQPHHTRRDGADHRQMRISTRREPSLR